MTILSDCGGRFIGFSILIDLLVGFWLLKSGNDLPNTKLEGNFLIDI
jgi:hypothetical protein